MTGWFSTAIKYPIKKGAPPHWMTSTHTMGQAASTTAQHSPARRPPRRAQEEERLQETPRPRTRTSSLRNSLRGLVTPKRRHSVAGSPDAGSGSNSRRASRRWSRALSFRPPSPAPPPEHPAEDVLSLGSLDTDLVEEDPNAEDDELSAFDAGEPDPPRERPPTPMPHRTPTPPPPALPTLALPLPLPAPAPPPPQHTGTFPPLGNARRRAGRCAYDRRPSAAGA
ncbi:hypothetical protein B0H14DRAFT_3602440 [Mycena olivaceomarginata]|nr:hypothetical protein B0H14DRAFT_3602440 [Mycena olivaceomarginata]